MTAMPAAGSTVLDRSEQEGAHPGQLPRTAPEAQGVSSGVIAGFVEAVERQVQHLHSFMLLRHGAIIAEGWWAPYRPNAPHLLFSLSKSFTSTAIGLLVADGRLTVDDPVLSFFPEDAPADPGEHLRALRVRHLLTMTAGHGTDPTPAVFGQHEVPWTRAFFAQPMEFAPGTRFVYNTAATYMLAAIAQRLTGQRLVDFLRPRLFDPLGIEQATWETSPQGIDVGGSGLSLTTEAIARFGQLYLQQGTWQGKELVSASWIAEATARQVPNGPSPNPDWEQGYGYQFWRCRHGVYRGDGAFGQYCLVMPEQDAVLAITSGLRNMQQVLDLVWSHLLPALTARAEAPSSPAAGPAGNSSALASKLASLHLPLPHGAATSPTAVRVSGRTYTLAPNDQGLQSVSFTFEEGDSGGCTISVGTAAGAQPIVCGHGEWCHSVAALERSARWNPRPVARKVAAAGAWVEPDTYLAQLWWNETPFARTLTCRFHGEHLEHVSIAQQANVGFDSLDHPTLTGHAAP